MRPRRQGFGTRGRQDLPAPHPAAGTLGTHPLPQPLRLGALGLQLLPPLGRGRVGLPQGAGQLIVAVLEREELSFPLHLAHGAVGQGQVQGQGQGPGRMGERAAARLGTRR